MFRRLTPFLAAFGLAVSASAAPPAAGTVELPAVTVIGKRPLKDAPERSSEFTGERWELSPARPAQLPEILRQSPGVIVRHAGGEGTPADYLIRGLDPIQQRFFLEGVPLSDAAYNAASATAWLPMESIGAVELYAEGVPLFLGDDGLGGAVQFRLPSRCRGAGFGTRAGSFGYLRVFGDPCLGPARLGISYAQSSEDFLFYDDNGTPLVGSDDRVRRREHNGFRRATVFPQAELGRVAGLRLRSFGLGAYGEKEVPGPTTSPSFARLSQGYALAALLADGESVDGHLYGRLSSERFEPAAGALPSLAPGRASGGEVGTRLRARWRRWLGADWEALAGVTWEAFDAQGAVGAVGGGARERLQLPVGLGAEWRFGALALKPALVAHGYRYARGAGERSYGLLSPRLGATLALTPRWQLRSAVGSYYRAPTLAELYGSPTGIAPNEHLDVERAVKAELGTDLEWRRPTEWLRSVRLSYTFSVTRARDLVSYAQSSPTTRTAVNLGEGRILAHELAAEVKSRWDLSLRAGAALFSTVNLSDVEAQRGRQLPFRPPYRVTLGLGWERERWGLGYEALLTGPVYWDPANEKRMAPVTEHGLRGWWDTGGFGVVSLEIANLGDVTTAMATQVGFASLDNSAGYPGFPAPGRRWYLTWKYEL